MRIFSSRSRPVHLGRFPLERLPRAAVSEEVLRSVRKPAPPDVNKNVLAGICREYCAI
jgi:hypothetical protein